VLLGFCGLKRRTSYGFGTLSGRRLRAEDGNKRNGDADDFYAAQIPCFGEGKEENPLKDTTMRYITRGVQGSGVAARV